MPHNGLPLLSWASPIFQKLRLNSTVKWESTPLGATTYVLQLPIILNLPTSIFMPSETSSHLEALHIWR